jgi:hypothetical protein
VFRHGVGVDLDDAVTHRAAAGWVGDDGTGGA